MDAIRTALDRLVNELPTIAAGVVAVLYVFGTDVAQADVDAVLEHAEAVVGFGLWLFVRSRTEGPVTKAKTKPSVTVTATETPDLVHWQEWQGTE